MSHANSSSKPDKKCKRPAPLSIRLTPEMRVQLEQWAREAGGVSLNRYVIETLFAGDAGTMSVRSSRRSMPSLDQVKLSQALALMGHMDTAHDLRSLAKSAALGCLPVTPEVDAAITAACQDMGLIKSHIMAALRVAEA
ncbi:MAG: hypothetical protein MRY72_00980 [Aquisalinus sp.]|nr:hypothetical protein [Aquisalinus sp.]